MKIVADSSANIISLDGVSFASAPLKVITDCRKFVDDANSNAEEMIQYFETYKGKSKTSCPNTVDWLDALVFPKILPIWFFSYALIKRDL